MSTAWILFQKNYNTCIYQRKCAYKESCVDDGQAECLFYNGGGKRMSGVEWWRRAGGFENPYLDKVWRTKRDGLIWTKSPRIPPNIRMVCLWVSVQKKRNLGNRFFHKGRLIAGVVERTGGGWWGRGRVGLYSNPTYRPLTPKSAHMFRISLQKKENRWGLWGLGVVFRGSLLSNIASWR